LYKLFKLYDFILESVTAIFFAIMVVLLFGQVISRYFFNFPIMWAEEVGRYLFVWIVYLGAAQAFFKRRHLAVDFLAEKLSPPYSTYLNLILYSIIMVFLFFVFLYGLRYVGLSLSKPAYSVKLISLGWVYASVPIGCLFMIFNIIRTIPTILHNEERM